MAAEGTNQNEDGTDETEETVTKPSSDSTVLAPGTSESSGAASQAVGAGAAGEVKPWWKFW